MLKEKNDFYEVILLAILALWISLAMGSIDLNKKEVNILHRYPIARILVVFLFIFVFLNSVSDVENFDREDKILASFMIVLIYVYVVEKSSFETEGI